MKSPEAVMSSRWGSDALIPFMWLMHEDLAWKRRSAPEWRERGMSMHPSYHLADRCVLGRVTAREHPAMDAVRQSDRMRLSTRSSYPAPPAERNARSRIR